MSTKYRCLRCRYVWTHAWHPTYGVDGSLIGYAAAAACPACGHEYVEVQP